MILVMYPTVQNYFHAGKNIHTRSVLFLPVLNAPLLSESSIHSEFDRDRFVPFNLSRLFLFIWIANTVSSEICVAGTRSTGSLRNLVQRL